MHHGDADAVVGMSKPMPWNLSDHVQSVASEVHNSFTKICPKRMPRPGLSSMRGFTTTTVLALAFALVSVLCFPLPLAFIV